MTLIEEIRDKVGEAELLAQMAEEAAELSQAALKLRRKLDGSNPTPKTERELRANLDEELADVAVCVSALELDTKWELMRKKICRWVERLEENDEAQR
jgi:NTP pyrophosphatase (non-canonical NTP hydrolase)